MGISISFLSIGSQVPSASFVNSLVLMIFVAVTLSMVSLLLITQYHLALISLFMMGFSCMTLSHLRTQIRYTDSDRRIWKCWVGAWCVLFCCHHWLFPLNLPGCRVMLPQPSIIPTMISGHGMFQCGHRDFTSHQMVCVVLSLHCVSMWLIDSDLLHVMHVSLSS